VLWTTCGLVSKMFVGADSCKAGWFAVIIDGEGRWSASLFRDAEHLWLECQDALCILIDIPIGLRYSDSQERLCDTEARKVLGPKRGTSVFPAPCRPALLAGTYAEGSRINREHTGRRLSKQSWSLVSKIREVDELLGRNRIQGQVREIHPEVCFAALNRLCPMEQSKKSEEGFRERLAVLRRAYPQAQEVVEYALAKWKRREVAQDDILDALAAAVTAYLGRGRLRTYPNEPETDSEGRKMEMVYCPYPP